MLKSNELPVAADLGSPLPPSSQHSVSVSLPRWQDTIDYEESNDRVLNALKTGYPRFFIHPLIKELSRRFIAEYSSSPSDQVFIFPCKQSALECKEYVGSRFAGESSDSVNVVEFHLADNFTVFCAVCGSDGVVELAKQFWQHTGTGISSRLAEFALSLLAPTLSDEEKMVSSGKFVDILLAGDAAKQVIQRHLSSLRGGCNDDDIFLFPSGMNSIYHVHQVLMAVRGRALKSVQFGFGYVDTIRILERFGPGSHFYPRGNDEELAELENLLVGGEQILALFCECPSNPLLSTPRMYRLRELSLKYNFPIVVDDTLGNICNLKLEDKCDFICTSLTKIYSGVGDVMAGCLTCIPTSPFYRDFLDAHKQRYQDMLWHEDAVILRNNAANAQDRITQANETARIVATYLVTHPLVEQLYYPLFHGKKNYDEIRLDDGGYGSLLSFTLKQAEIVTPTFFDNMHVAKGPSLGTNFTLACAYTQLAHYQELDLVEHTAGVSRHLIRLAIGLEDPQLIIETLAEAFDKIAQL